MNKSDAIKKIKELLNFNSEVVAVIEFSDVKDVEGNILRTISEELVIGDELKLVTEAGEELTPDAEYTLEDGRIVKTDAEGKISEIIEAEVIDEVVEEEVEAAEEIIEPVVEEVVEEVDNDGSVESRISQLEELVKQLILDNSKVAEATMSMADLVEKYGEMPATKEVMDLKNTFSSIEKENKKSQKEIALERISRLRSKN